MGKFDWDRYVPLGVDGKKSLSGIGLGLGFSAVLSLRFFLRLSMAYGDLFVWRNGVKYLRDGAKMPPFGQLRSGCFLPFAVVALALALSAAEFYFRHYQGSRSIYTMKRLPNRWELWRRVLTLPLCGIAACGLCVALLTALYYGIYLLVTPAGCLP